MDCKRYARQLAKSEFKVPTDRWIALKQYYISMHRYYMLRMYDMGYCSDPTSFDEKEIRSVIADIGLFDFCKIDGSVVLSSEFTRFYIARLVARGVSDEDTLSYLRYLEEALRYKEYCSSIDKAYELNRTGVTFTLMMNGSSRLVSGIDIEYNRGIVSLIVPDGYTVSEVSFKDKLFDFAMAELGIKEYEDGMFIRGMPHEEEVLYSNMILEGLVSLDGKYANDLLDWLGEHKWSKISKPNVIARGLYSEMFANHCFEVISIMEEYEKKYGKDALLFIDDKVFIPKKVGKFKFPTSPLAVLYSTDDEEELCDVSNSLYGYFGEAYTKSCVEFERIPVYGVPVMVGTKKGCVYAYDRSQLMIEGGSSSWFSRNVKNMELSEDVTVNKKFEEGSIEDALKKAYIEGSKQGLYITEDGFKYPGYVALVNAIKKLSNMLKGRSAL